MNIGLRYADRLVDRCAPVRILAFSYKKDGVKYMLPVLWEKAMMVDKPIGLDLEMLRLRAFNDTRFGGSDFAPSENCIHVVICHVEKKVCFGPRGHIGMRPKGVGLGGSLMSWLIHEMKEGGLGDYTIEPGQLGGVDAKTDEDRLRRNSFYMGLGFSLSSCSATTGIDVVGGMFTAPNIGALIDSPQRLARLVRWRDFEAEQRRAFNPPTANKHNLNCRRPAQLGPLRRIAVRLLGIH
ncbi:hypothetical protein QAO71_17440 (plasmid) [Halopseudomonas sp. SMJS2]|uniref:hypothetical protein n=1 Tax=Halopseudomonas sp. SMJS2 TaxID=3041098 RepID=UPI002452AC14|nr:hypothetical protein [Halopseudomonas sp. SMJS2]WGK63553.1 hypothetical protein QAO71_17440 [Halopseudomonas sp. SMJS2]